MNVTSRIRVDAVTNLIKQEQDNGDQWHQYQRKKGITTIKDSINRDNINKDNNCIVRRFNKDNRILIILAILKEMVNMVADKIVVGNPIQVLQIREIAGNHQTIKAIKEIAGNHHPRHAIFHHHHRLINRDSSHLQANQGVVIIFRILINNSHQIEVDTHTHVTVSPSSNSHVMPSVLT